MINENINSLEPIVLGFGKESKLLLNLARTIPVQERQDVMIRGFVAREFALEFQYEITNKLEMLSKLKRFDALMTYATLSRVKFMTSRVNEMKESLTRA